MKPSKMRSDNNISKRFKKPRSLEKTRLSSKSRWKRRRLKYLFSKFQNLVKAERSQKSKKRQPVIKKLLTRKNRRPLCWMSWVFLAASSVGASAADTRLICTASILGIPSAPLSASRGTLSCWRKPMPPTRMKRLQELRSHQLSTSHIPETHCSYSTSFVSFYKAKIWTVS